MFATVRIISDKLRFFARIKSYFFPVSPKISGKVILGIPYIEVGLTPFKGKIPWFQLRGLYQGAIDCIIPEKGLVLPDEFEPLLSDSRDFYGRLTINFLREEIKRQGKNQRINVLFYDPQGLLTPQATELLKAAAQVTAVTDHPEKYSKHDEYTLSEIGAVINTLTVDDNLPLCDYLAAPLGVSGFPPYSPKKAIFAPECRRGALHPDKEVLTLPLSLLKDCPEYLDPFELAAALYNDGSVDCLGEIIPATVTTR